MAGKILVWVPVFTNATCGNGDVPTVSLWNAVIDPYAILLATTFPWIKTSILPASGDPLMNRTIAVPLVCGVDDPPPPHDASDSASATTIRPAKIPVRFKSIGCAV